MKKSTFIIMLISIFALSALFSDSDTGYVEYSGTGATSYTAVLNVSFTSNGDTLSVGFSSTNPNDEDGKITPITVVNLSSVLGFDNGRRTVTGQAGFYPYWQIQNDIPLKVVFSRSENLVYSAGTLSYSSNLDSSESEIVLCTYYGDNSFVKSSTAVTINTSDVSGLPYGTSFSGTVTLKVITT